MPDPYRTPTPPVRARSWRDHAACLGADTETFFPDKWDRALDAKRLCAACPVRTPCLAYAMTHTEAGVWGGLTESERAAQRRGGSRPRTHCRNGHDLTTGGVDRSGACKTCRINSERRRRQRQATK